MQWAAICDGDADPVRIGRERGRSQQRKIASPHDMQVDRVQSGHDQNAGEQSINFEFRCERSRQGSCKKAARKSGSRREERIDAMDQEDGGQRRAERTGTVCSNIGKSKDSKADVNTQSNEGKNEPEGERAQQKTHARAFSAVVVEIGDIQHAPRTNSLSPAPEIARSSVSK